MKIAIAQIQPAKGDILANIASHKQMIARALVHQSDCIFFPELSITGYEPTLADSLATDVDDMLFDGFQQLSDRGNITIGIWST